MNIIEDIFKNRRLTAKKLVPYGFICNNGIYEFSTELAGCGLILTVRITADGRITALTADPAAEEVYTLHTADGATGGFVGKVRAEYERVLRDISDKCFEPFVFKTRQADMCINYIRDKYGRELEFLWDKFPDDAIWRRADNGKWFGILLKVQANKLGIDGDGLLEVIDLRMLPAQKAALIDGEKYLPGYHMNKNSWFTVVLDGRVPDNELWERIDNSYILANRK